MHTCNTTVIASATGEIVEYRFSITAEHGGEPTEIAACITASLDMIRESIAASFAGLIAQIAAAQGAAEPSAPAQSPPASTQSPATPEEARARFYIRYGTIVGGSSWSDVQRYLRRTRTPEPTTVQGWIATAEAVRDRSKAQQAAPERREYARH